jgi:EAL domain-containing protein (putative c-di-GMP-specific phosphodiesterase class I)
MPLQIPSAATLAAALTGHGMHHAFQPIWRLGDGSLLGFEALARFADGTPPDAIWREARARGQAVDLDRLSVSAALRAAHSLPGLLFVNVAAVSFFSPEPPGAAVRAAVRQTGREGRCVVEVTEDAVRDGGHLATRAAMLRSLGLQLALDDAGAGAATPTRLALLAPRLRFLKLDRGLVQAWLRRGGGALPAWVELAAALGLPCVAEGVEEPEAAGDLAAAGVQYVQGFGFGPPHAPEHWTATRLDAARPRLPAPQPG